MWNTITLSDKEGVAPNVTASMGSMGRNSILTGEVLAVEGTMVQVDFHSPGDAPLDSICKRLQQLFLQYAGCARHRICILRKQGTVTGSSVLAAST